MIMAHDKKKIEVITLWSMFIHHFLAFQYYANKYR